jgi:hypothetical protein
VSIWSKMIELSKAASVGLSRAGLWGISEAGVRQLHHPEAKDLFRLNTYQELLSGANIDMCRPYPLSSVSLMRARRDIRFGGDWRRTLERAVGLI